MNNLWWVAMAALVAASWCGRASSQELPAFEFGKSIEGWQPTHGIARLQGTPEGLRIEISGDDPYAMGPALEFPGGTALWLRMRIQSETGGGCQVFYFKEGSGPTEAQSVHFSVKAGEWTEARAPLPALQGRWRFRIDPPGASGTAVVAWMRFEPRVTLKQPAWPRPTAPRLGTQSATVKSGDLELLHGPDGPGEFELRAAGQPVAIGLNRPLIGYLSGDELRWVDLRQVGTTRLQQGNNALRMTVAFRDPDGADWQMVQRFSASQTLGSIEVEVTVSVSADRSVAFLPMIAVLPGAGCFGEQKGQGLFAGLEYLDNEPSSSEADIRGPAARRQVPDSAKITFPLMAIQAEGRYVGLVWEMVDHFSALFDSPDRFFQSGGHLMGILFPGSNGENREEGNLLPDDGATIRANQPLVLRATLIGGQGASVVPVVQHYVRLRGLPPVPDTGMTAQQYYTLAAHGWLDSKGREGDLFRHAYWPGFGPAPAADAALFCEWLALQTRDAALAARLREAAQAFIARVAPANYNGAGVSHVGYPVESLIYGAVAANAEAAGQGARGLLNRFEPDGSVLYRARQGQLDYGSTHWEQTANGLTAPVVASLLQSAAVAGDRAFIQEGVRLLRALDRYLNTVPRGAQTWEIPLHTPDILASAHLVDAYLLGYELTGERSFLDHAIYWAWSGVPFVYLVNPTPGPVGPYSTIPVLGGTAWVGSWFGRPVQWCGLVYADALYRLARHEAAGPWKQLADGITAAGIQHTWPLSDAERQGLLPDFYLLKAQYRDGPAINPGTVQANAIRLFGGPEVYDFHAFHGSGLLLHAPGVILDPKEEGGVVSFRVKGWIDRPYYLLLNGFQGAPQVKVNGQSVALTAPNEYDAARGRLILQVSGSPEVEVRQD